MVNPWLIHLRKYAAEHKNLTYTQAMIAAKASYTKVPKTGAGHRKRKCKC